MPTPSIQIKRHSTRLSEKETTELVEAVAEMVVAFIKSRKCERGPKNPRQLTATEQAAP